MATTTDHRLTVGACWKISNGGDSQRIKGKRYMSDHFMIIFKFRISFFDETS